MKNIFLLLITCASLICHAETNSIVKAKEAKRLREQIGQMYKQRIAVKNIEKQYGITNPTPEQISRQISVDEYHEEMTKLSLLQRSKTQSESSMCDNVSKYSIEGFRDTGGPYAHGMKQHGTTAAALGEAYSFWAATSFGDGHAASTIWFRKINVDAAGRIVSIGPAEKSVKVCTDF